MIQTGGGHKASPWSTRMIDLSDMFSLWGLISLESNLNLSSFSWGVACDVATASTRHPQLEPAAELARMAEDAPRMNKVNGRLTRCWDRMLRHPPSRHRFPRLTSP